MKIIPKITPPRDGAPAAPTPQDPAALRIPGGAERAPALSLTPVQLAQRAGEVAALVTELGVPELSPAAAADLVLAVEPRVRAIADSLAFALPQAPAVARRSGQSAEALGERNGQIGALIGVRRIGEQGERACRLLRGARVKGELDLLGRLLAEIEAERQRLAGDPVASARLAADAGELLELLSRRDGRRAEQLGKGRAQAAAGEDRVKELARETRHLRTLVALQGGEAVSDEDAAEALAYLEREGAPAEDSRRAPR